MEPSADGLSLHSRWLYVLALRGVEGVKEKPAPTSLATLDADALRAIASALPRACDRSSVWQGTRAAGLGDARAAGSASVNGDSCSVSGDRRTPGLAAMASVNGWFRRSLRGMIEAQRHEHRARLAELAGVCDRLGVTLKAMSSAAASFSAPGGECCATCGALHPHLGGLFLRAGPHEEAPRPSLRDPHAPDQGAADGAEEAPMVIERGRSHCAVCWRAGYELSMRPMGTGEEQMWEAPIEDGTWQLVRDFTHEDLDSPILTREEWSPNLNLLGSSLVRHTQAEASPPNTPPSAPTSELTTRQSVGALHSQSLVNALRESGYALSWQLRGLDSHVTTLRSVERTAEEERRPSRLGVPLVPLVADLICSGYADQLLSIELSNCGLDDAGFGLLSRALVGHALHLQYLDVSENPISDDGVCAFAELLETRRGELMLPLLRWLHIHSLPPTAWEEAERGGGIGERALVALARALFASALPSLELIWCESLVFREALTDGVEQIKLVGTHAAFKLIVCACAVRSIDLDFDGDDPNGIADRVSMRTLEAAFWGLDQEAKTLVRECLDLFGMSSRFFW